MPRFVAFPWLLALLIIPSQGDAANRSREIHVARTRGQTVATSPNFQVTTSLSNVDLRQLTDECERCRAEFLSAWLTSGGAASTKTWSPRCVIVIHESQAAYKRVLGPAAGSSSGCTTIRAHAGAVTERRIDVRADADAWSVDALPHELMHVVLADRFGDRPLPLWADEGMAVLAESDIKRRKRDEAAAKAEQGSHPVTAADLLYDSSLPASPRHQAFYARSADLVGYLIDRRDRATFLSFLERTRTGGYDAALRDTYNINGVAHLQRLWADEMNGRLELAESK